MVQAASVLMCDGAVISDTKGFRFGSGYGGFHLGCLCWSTVWWVLARVVAVDSSGEVILVCYGGWCGGRC